MKVGRSPLGTWRGSTLLLVIPLPPPPLQNERERSHWSTNHATAKDWQMLIRNAARLADAQLMARAEIRYRYYYPVYRQRDPDGLLSSTKPLTDALRHAGVIAGDHAEVLSLLPVDVHVDKVCPRVEIYVREF